MDENSRDQTHAEAAESSIAELVLSDPPRLILGRDDMVIAVLRGLASRMDTCADPKVYAALSVENRLWWTTVVMPKGTVVAGESIFDGA